MQAMLQTHDIKADNSRFDGNPPCLVDCLERSYLAKDVFISLRILGLSARYMWVILSPQE